jgi:glycine/serine hydroxymethyltransferase
MKEAEMQLIGTMIGDVIREPESEDVRKRVRSEVAELAAQFPMYSRRYKDDQNEARTAG